MVPRFLKAEEPSGEIDQLKHIISKKSHKNHSYFVAKYFIINLLLGNRGVTKKLDLVTQ